MHMKHLKIGTAKHNNTKKIQSKGVIKNFAKEIKPPLCEIERERAGEGGLYVFTNIITHTPKKNQNKKSKQKNLGGLYVFRIQKRL